MFLCAAEVFVGAARLGRREAMLGPSAGQVAAMLGHLERWCGYDGPSGSLGGYVGPLGPCLAYVGLSWPYLGPCWPCVDPVLALC